MSYSDFVAFVIIFLMLPSISVKLLINLIPITLAILLAKHKRDKSSNVFLTFCRKYSNGHNKVEKALSHGLSILLHPIGAYRRYRKNKKMIKFLRKKTNPNYQQSVKFDKLPSNIRHAIEKEGLWTVWWQMLFLFSLLPSVRHIFMNNPFLFDYQLRLTNQSSEEFIDQKKMCQILYSYINNPAFILKHDPNKNVSQLSFTPNYYNDPTDHIIDHNQIGLQISGIFATLIYLDTVYKTPDSLYQSILQKKYDSCLMHQDHPIYEEIEEGGFQLLHHVNFDPAHRVKLLDLVVPYDDYYHIVTGKIEANIKADCQVEHPMLCLYHDGFIMRKFWDTIHRIFQDGVMVYLKSLEE